MMRVAVYIYMYIYRQPDRVSSARFRDDDEDDSRRRWDINSIWAKRRGRLAHDDLGKFGEF